MRSRQLIGAILLAAGACGPRGPEQPTPAAEWLCTGRTSTAQVTVKVEAATREEAITKVKEQYPDMANPFCSINVRR